MGWGEQGFPSCCKGYGLPLYSAAWVKKGTDKKWTLLLGGGGGDGQRGIPSELLLCEFSPNSMSLSDEPVRRWNVDMPRGIAVHPKEDVACCSFSNSCSWFKIDSGQDQRFAELLHNAPEDARLQLALAFNNRKSLLATGSELFGSVLFYIDKDHIRGKCASCKDGHLRLFKWINDGFQLKCDQTVAHTSVKDLAFSYDGMLLASLGNSGYCCVWKTDEYQLVPTAYICRQNDEVFEFCRFSKKVLYLTSRLGRHWMIGSWNCDCLEPEEKVRKQIAVSDPISAFDISADGKLLAIGTIEGDILILRSSNMNVLTVVKKAHSGLVTALAFSKTRELLSTSVDARARVTVTKETGRLVAGFRRFCLLMALLVALLAYLVMGHGFRRKNPSSLCLSIFSSLNFGNSSYNFGFGQTARAAPYNEYAAT